jgi:signal transduction histidine kinase
MRSLAATIAAGHGEMAELIRTKDWSRTPLGPMESWPQSLRTAVSIGLGSKHPIVLWWGPERTMIYNDSYRPMLGASKHPQFLGGSGQECWAEIWEVIGPMMSHVLQTGEATWSEDLLLVMDRSGYQEETYFTFSYSPIRDESGEPKGIFNACTETTTRVLGERRLKTLREMSVEARTAKEAAEVCTQVLGRNRRDIPFALVYLVDESNRQLHLASQSGIEPGLPASPVIVDIARTGDTMGLPLARVVRSGRGERIVDLGRRFEELPSEPWNASPDAAMVLPIARPGSPTVSGVVVLGISPRRAFDDAYQGFFEMVAGHIATAVANARAYEEERARAEKLAELDRAKTAFFSNVSHELRTPLTLILGPMANALATGEKTLTGEDFDLVHHNALRLLRLVNTLLEFARLEAGRLETFFVPTDLSALTAGLASSFRSSIERAGLSFVVDCPALPEPIYVDPGKWEKIVLNLLSNAFKFTFRGEIALRLRWLGDRVELSIRDTGIGIPTSELSHVFERFHRVENAKGRSFEGTGIGLSLVRELTRLHGGSVSMNSIEGTGSTFFVSIPTGRDHLPPGSVPVVAPVSSGDSAELYVLEASQWLDGGEAPKTGSTSAAEPASSSKGDARVLVVDDNPEMRRYLERILSSAWNVDVASDGDAALAVARARRPDLVLSDIMMPRKDGVALLRELRADPLTKDVPIVLLSARAGEEAMVEGLEIGADDYLVKPFSARELIARIRTHLELARTRRQWAIDLADATRVNEAKTNFLRLVSHEFRTPLSALKLQLTRLSRGRGDLKTTDAQREILERMNNTTARLVDLVESILAYARIESGRWVATSEPFDLVEVTRTVVDDLRPTLEGKSLRLTVEVPDGGLEMKSDQQLVRLVLTNLLGNAIKFTRQGVVRVRVDRSEDGVRLMVDDTGPGIDAAEHTRIFEPFQQGEPVASKHTQGVGLGLALVKEMVAALGGTIDLRSEVGKGSRFLVDLPMVSTDRGA